MSVMIHVGEQLWEHVLGTLDAVEGEAVRAHLVTCEACRREEAIVSEALAQAALLADASAPSPAVRARLEEALAGAPLPYEHLAASVAAFFALTVDQVQALFARARSAASWEPAPLPGMMLFHLRAGAAWAHADAGLVRYVPGAVFPEHLHLGDERSLVVHGGLRLQGGAEDGRVVGPGGEFHAAAGSSHGFVVLDEGCVFALTLEEGIRIGDFVLNARTAR